MKIVELSEEEMLKEVERPHNPPQCEDERALNEFQRELTMLYGTLTAQLWPMGIEGSIYGISDFHVQPDPRGPVPRTREFIVTIISDAFFRSDYLRVVHRFLTKDAPLYRIWIGQDVFRDWSQDIFITKDEARVFCDHKDEMDHLRNVLESL